MKELIKNLRDLQIKHVFYLNFVIWFDNFQCVWKRTAFFKFNKKFPISVISIFIFASILSKELLHLALYQETGN